MAEGDPIIELVERYLTSDRFITFPKTMADYLRSESVAQRITDESLRTATAFLEWEFERLSRILPSPGSNSMARGFLAGDTDWYEPFIRAFGLGVVTYHATRLYGTPRVSSYAAYILAQLLFRVGMDRSALALLERAADAFRDGGDPALLVACVCDIAECLGKRLQHGKAWAYLEAGLAHATSVHAKLRIHLWKCAAVCLKNLHRAGEAAAYYKKIADTDEARVMPPQGGLRVLRNPAELDAGNFIEVGGERWRPLTHADFRPGFASLADEMTAEADGIAHGSGLGVISMWNSNYAHLNAAGPVKVAFETPHGSVFTHAASNHELYDWLWRRAAPLLTIRASLSWRAGAVAYLRGWTPLVESLVKTALKIGLPHRALEWLEAFRATTLLQRMAAAIGPCPDGVDVRDWEKLAALIRSFREAVAEDERRAEGISSTLAAAKAEREVIRLTASLRSQHAHLAPTFGAFTIRRELPTRDSLSAVSPRTRIVEYFCGDDVGGCWIIDPARPDRPSWIDLPGLSQPTVSDAAKRLHAAILAWKGSTSPSKLDEALAALPHDVALARVCEAVESAVEFCRTTALEPLQESISFQTIDRLILIPHKALHALPMHAAIAPHGPVVSYAPSLAVLSRLRSRRTTGPPRALVMADSIPDCPASLCSNPSERSCWRLPGARLEGQSVADFLRERGCTVESAFGPDATSTWLESRLPDVAILHIATHATFDADEPSHCGFVFAPGPRTADRDVADLLDLSHDGSAVTGDDEPCSRLWTLSRMWRSAEMTCCQLAVLSGCETAVVHAEDALEDFLGLAGGFLQAGVPSVVGSMWEVTDLATLLWSRRFYRRLDQAFDNPSAALADTQAWLRSVTFRQIVDDESDLVMEYYSRENGSRASSCEEALQTLLGEMGRPSSDFQPFSSPFYWAPFRCVGLP